MQFFYVLIISYLIFNNLLYDKCIDEKIYLNNLLIKIMDKKIVTVRRKSIHDKYVHIKKDLPKIIFLIFLYFLQAV